MFWKGTFRHSAILARRGNKQKVKHFRRHFDNVYWIDYHPFRVTHRANEFTVHSACQTHQQPWFSNQTCVLIRPTCLTLSLNKKFEAILTYDIHWISVFTNQRVNQGKHRHQPQIFVGLQLKVFKPREFYSIEIFAVQSLSRQSCYVNVYKVLCVLSCGHWAYLFTRTYM